MFCNCAFWLFSRLYIDLSFSFYLYFFFPSSLQQPGIAGSGRCSSPIAAPLRGAGASLECYSWFGSGASAGCTPLGPPAGARLSRAVPAHGETGRLERQGSRPRAGPGLHWGILQVKISPLFTTRSIKAEGERALRSSAYTFSFYIALNIFWRFLVPVGSGTLLYSLHVWAWVYVVWVSDSSIAKQGTSLQEVISGGKITLVHCCGSFLSDIPDGACVLFIMKSVPVGFLNINLRRPIHKCNSACGKNMSKSFPMWTLMLQKTESLRRLWEIAVTHPVDVQDCAVLAV